MEIAIHVFAKIMRIVFSGLWSTTRLSLHIGLSACYISDDTWRPLPCYAFIKIKFGIVSLVALCSLCLPKII